jgi:hypothetical protein
MWEDLLFAHWQFEPDVVRKLVPPQMELDTMNGAAYIGVVPFKMRKVRPRFTPLLPVISDFLELNVRTYVVVDGIPGVYFFSLDCASLFAVEGARTWFHLPYYYAQMSVVERDGDFRYLSKRVDRRGEPAALEVRYGASGAPFFAQEGTLEHFLTERYCLYTVSGDNTLLRAHIHHPPWPLQDAHADFAFNTMLSPIGLEAVAKPHLLFAKSVATVEWPPEVVSAV